MFKVYQKYIIKNFLIKFLNISLIFFCLTVIMGVLEEISFFKNLNANFLFPYFLTILNAPITLFEIFPFIFLITTQFLFYDFFKKDELNLLKKSGLSNTRIIKIIFLLSLAVGIFTVAIYYNFASKLKFHYTSIKNEFSLDNKYLAMVTESGLWIKDEIDGSIFIIKSKYIEDNFLTETVINEFNSDFELIRIIQSKKIDIEKSLWNIYNPTITKENISTVINNKLTLKTNFNYEKINNLFSNISTLNLLELFTLKKDYEKLGYSSDEIIIHLLKLFSMPLFYGVLTILSSIIMINFKKDKSLIFHIIIGILMSVIIYYMNFIFNSLGNNGKIPVYASIFLPILFISIISTMGLIRVNEK
jgi:lipopolysaccharide export system permease protein